MAWSAVGERSGGGVWCGSAARLLLGRLTDTAAPSQSLAPPMVGDAALGSCEDSGGGQAAAHAAALHPPTLSLKSP